MHTKISPENPYEHGRWAFAWEHIARGGASHLDFGCHDGAFLNSLNDKGIGRLVGVDVSEEAVRKGRQRFPELEIIKISDTPVLPFEDGVFSSASILDVLEHLCEQAELLRELRRVLADKGRLIVTVPGRHLFSFLDMGNLKFLFPRLHRWYYRRSHSREEYEQRYVSNPEGLIGDVSDKKRWHEHFSRGKLRNLLTETGFSVIDFDGTGYFRRVIIDVRYFMGWIRPMRRALTRLERLDARRFESSNLFCVAEKS